MHTPLPEPHGYQGCSSAWPRMHPTRDGTHTPVKLQKLRCVIISYVRSFLGLWGAFACLDVMPREMRHKLLGNHSFGCCDTAPTRPHERPARSDVSDKHCVISSGISTPLIKLKNGDWQWKISVNNCANRTISWVAVFILFKLYTKKKKSPSKRFTQG